MRLALRAAGYTGVVTNTLEYDPRLVASASGASVFVQTAPFEAAAEHARTWHSS